MIRLSVDQEPAAPAPSSSAAWGGDAYEGHLRSMAATWEATHSKPPAPGRRQLGRR